MTLTKEEYNRRYREKLKQKRAESDGRQISDLPTKQEVLPLGVEPAPPTNTTTPSLEIDEDEYREFLEWKASKKKETKGYPIMSLLPVLLPPLIGIIQRSIARMNEQQQQPQPLPTSGVSSADSAEPPTDNLGSFFQ